MVPFMLTVQERFGMLSMASEFDLTTLEDSAFIKDRQENIAKQLRYKYPFSASLLLTAIKDILDSKEYATADHTNRQIKLDSHYSWHWAVQELLELELHLENTPDISGAMKKGQHI